MESTLQYLTKHDKDLRVFKAGLLGYDPTDPFQDDFHDIDEETRNTPQPIDMKVTEIISLRGIPLKQISAGGYHCAVLTSYGEVYTWNKFGQLGTGDFVDRKEPTKIHLNAKIVQIKASGRHTLLLSDDGRVYSFGCGEDGRLGHGDLKNQNYPKQIASLEGYRVVYMETGFWHCILATACDKVFVFGNNEEGKLGTNDCINRLVPVEIVELRGMGIKAAAGGAWHTILLTKEGRVYAFGSNYWGQLGLATSSNNLMDCLIPKEVEFFRNKKIVNVAAGSNYSLCLTEEGKVYSFGCGSNCKTGHGTTLTQIIPKLVEFPYTVKSIHCGSNHTLFLCENGNVYSFGWNKYCQLGHEDGEEHNFPKLVNALKNMDIKAVSAGAYFTVFTTSIVKGITAIYELKN